MPGIGQSGASPAPHSDSLGVIISLPAALTAELNRWRESFGGAAVTVVPPHVTLVSGRATGPWIEAAEHVRKVAAAAAPFTIALQGTGTFEPISPVVYLNLVKGVPECIDLHEKLLAGPMDHLLEFDFHPHLTVAHDLDTAAMARAKAEMAGFVAEFEVNSIGLFDYSQDGWSLREELALGGSAEQ